MNANIYGSLLSLDFTLRKGFRNLPIADNEDLLYYSLCKRSSFIKESYLLSHTSSEIALQFLRDVMYEEMDTAVRVPILDEADCILHSTNTLGKKSLNPIILPPAMGK